MAKTRAEEPRPAEGEPLPSRPLNVRERWWWDYTVPLLRAMGVLAVADGEALTRYCRMAAAFDRTRNVDKMLKLDQSLNRLSRQFGLNPSARASLVVSGKHEAKPKSEEKSRFFSGPRLAVG